MSDQPPSAWDDQRIDQIIGNLLRTGVILATVVVLVGGSIYLVRHGTETVDYRSFTGPDRAFSTIAGVIDLVQHGRGRGVIQLGVFLLIGTPVARVIFSAVAFALQRDKTYVVVTLLVLTVLLVSMFAV